MEAPAPETEEQPTPARAVGTAPPAPARAAPARGRKVGPVARKGACLLVIVATQVLWLAALAYGALRLIGRS